ncbi:MAG: hypothetical protein LBB93_01125 [Elusimicrobiota bacterium]|nr:hypothetical protein [Elusimicrobiota bacterium]
MMPVLLSVISFCMPIISLLLFRESFAVFEANAFILGVMAAHFIFSLYLGYAAVAVKIFDEKLKKTWLFFVALLLVVFIAAFCGIRSLRGFLNIQLGAMITLKNAFIYSFLFISLPVFLSAVVSCLSLSLSRTQISAYKKISPTIYLFFGVLAGLVFYSLLLVSANGLAVVIFVSLVLITAFLIILKTQKLANTFLLILLGFLLSQPAHFIDRLDRKLLENNADGGVVEDYQYSAYGQNVLVSKNKEYTFLTNHIVGFSVPDNEIIISQDFGHIPMLHHSAPQKVLIIAGAMPLLSSILKYKVESVDYVEADKAVIDIMMSSAFLPPEIFDDKRLHIHSTPVRKFMRDKKYDVIFIGAPQPLNLALNNFYTKEFFLDAKKTLSSDGFVAMKLIGSSSYSPALAMRFNASIIKALQDVYGFVYVIPDKQNIIIASQTKMPARMQIKNRLAKIKEETLLLSNYYLDEAMDSEKVNWTNNELDKLKSDATENLDNSPSGMIFIVLQRQSRLSPLLSFFLQKAFDYSYFVFALPLVLFFVIKNICKETAFVSGLSTSGLFMISVFAAEIYTQQISKFAGVFAAIFMVGVFLSTIISKQIFKRKSLNFQILNVEGASLMLTIIYLVSFRFALINIGVLFVLVLAMSILFGVETIDVWESWKSSNLNKQGKNMLLLYSAIGGWLAALFGGGYMILALGFEQSFLLILIFRFIVFCRWADLRKKNVLYR